MQPNARKYINYMLEINDNLTHINFFTLHWYFSFGSMFCHKILYGFEYTFSLFYILLIHTKNESPLIWKHLEMCLFRCHSCQETCISPRRENAGWKKLTIHCCNSCPLSITLIRLHSTLNDLKLCLNCIYSSVFLSQGRGKSNDMLGRIWRLWDKHNSFSFLLLN